MIVCFHQDAWVAMHKDQHLVSKYMKPIEIGKVSSEVDKLKVNINIFSVLIFALSCKLCDVGSSVQLDTSKIIINNWSVNAISMLWLQR
jgi:hypothetical protein